MIDLENNWITRIGKNATQAIMSAKQLNDMPYAERGDIHGVQELLNVLDKVAIQLRHVCRHHQYDINGKLSKGKK